MTSSMPAPGPSGAPSTHSLGVVGLALLALAACSTGGSTYSDPSRIDPALHELGERLAHSLCAGLPAEVEPVPNRHVPGQVDRLETRDCTAGSSTLYVGQTTSDPRGIAVTVEVRAAGAGLPSHLEIGQPVEKAVRVLGPPRSRTSGTVTYGLGPRERDSVTIHYSAGSIASVQWEWMVD